MEVIMRQNFGFGDLAVMLILSGVVLGLGGNNPTSRDESSKPLPPGPGLSQASAINVCTPRGQVAYLSRLRCPGGRAPKFERGGRVGPRSDPRNKEEEQ